MARVRTDKVQVEVEINGKKAGTTLDELTKTGRQLRRELRKLSPDTEEFAKKAKELQAVDGKMKDIRDKIKGVNSEMKKSGGIMDSFKGALSNIHPAMLAAFAIGLVTKFFSTLKDGVVEIQNLRLEVEKLVSGTGQSLDDVTERVAAIGRTFDQDFNEVLVAANSVSKQLKVSLPEAFDLIEKGFLAGADVSGEFLSNLKEYPAQFHLAGLSAEESFALITQSVEGGVFGDKGVDLVKEFTLRVREQTTATREAMESAFGGDFADTIFNGINDGSLSAIEALKMVSTKMNDSEIPAKDLQTAIADIFGGAGEDAGIEFIKGMQSVETEMDSLIDTTSSLTKYQIDLLDAQKDLAAAENALAASTEGAGNGFRVVGIQLRAGLTQGIAFFTEKIGPIFLKWFEDARAAFSELALNLKPLKDLLVNFFNQFNSGAESSELLSISLDLVLSPLVLMVKVTNLLIDGFRYLIAGIQAIGDIAPKVFGSFKDIVLDQLGGVADVIVGIFTFDVEKIKAGFAKGTETIGEILDDFTGSVEDRYQALKPDPEPVAEAMEDVVNEVKKGGENITKATAEAEAERKKIEEKSGKERIKAEQAIEDLRIQLIQDKFDREIAQLRANSTRRIEALVGTPEQVQEQTDLINAVLDQQVAAVEAKRIEAEAKAEEARIAKKDADIETQLEEFAADEEREALLIDEKFSRAIDAETAHQEALYELRRESLHKQLRLLADAGKSESKEAKDLQNDILKNEIEHNKARVDNIKKTEDLKKAISQETASVLGDIFDFGIELLGKDEAARKKNAGILKAFAIFKIGVDLQQEIAGYMAHPANTSSFGVAGGIKTGLAIARATKAIIDITGKEYKDGVLLNRKHLRENVRRLANGGMTNLGGIPIGNGHDRGGIDLIERESGRHIGNMEGGEPIMVLSRATYANNSGVIDRLLDSSLYKGGAPILEDGGVINGGDQISSGGNESSNMMLNEIKGLRSDIQSFSGRLTAQVSYTEIEETASVVQNIREDSRF